MTTTHDSIRTPSGVLLTLNRGIQMLEQIARDEGRATAKSLAGDVGVNLGTCYQLLRTLQVNGYIHRLPGGRYALGSRIGYLAGQYERVASPAPELIDILHELHQTLHETVYIAVRRGGALEITEALEGTRMLRVGNMQTDLGGHWHVRASSRAFLAHVDSLIDYIDPAGFEPLTPNTITTLEALLDELEATRRRGYGRDDEECALGVACLGAVILDEEGRPFGAFGVSFPSARLAHDEAAIAAAVVDAGRRASRALGLPGSYPTGD